MTHVLISKGKTHRGGPTYRTYHSSVICGGN